MREIKFRAWDNDFNQWIPEESIIINRGKSIAVMQQTPLVLNDALCFPNNLVNPNWILQQYTGLKDKNGKEIYEGDIVNVKLVETDNDNFCKVTIGSQSMDINGGEYSTSYEGVGFIPFDNSEIEEGWYNYYKVEVIGNIYEDSELMKQ